MIGLQRLDHLQRCIETVLQDQVPGDLIEAGVWRGGATILMRGVLSAYGDQNRVVWVADSFRGLPPPDATRYPSDAGSLHWTLPEMAIPVEVVRHNFERYGLLDERVKFLVGWFKDTLATAPIQRLALIRLDGDMYESTWDSLTALYPKLAPGGYVLIDDFHYHRACRLAVEDYRTAHHIVEPIESVDWNSACWRRL